MTGRRPIVGVTAYQEPATWSIWEDAPAALVPLAYVEKIAAAGGRPVVLPWLDDAAAETLDALDAIVFTGGSDIEPAHYDAEAHPRTGEPRPARDRAELALLRAALARDLPLLAICRGSQLLNVALGGDIVQHLPDVLGHEAHKADPTAFGDHEVEIDPDSRLGGILEPRIEIKSHHHQGFDRLGAGLRPVAWAEDGIVEALELPSARFALGVLWHPEEAADRALFDALVAAARLSRPASHGM